MRCKQTKLNSDHKEKYEYRFCVCGCSYRMNLIHENDIVMVTETIVPFNHDHSVDVKLAITFASHLKFLNRLIIQPGEICLCLIMEP
jgi:hypothetical protein